MQAGWHLQCFLDLIFKNECKVGVVLECLPSECEGLSSNPSMAIERTKIVLYCISKNRISVEFG
jgi:hypothetical protein